MRVAIFRDIEDIYGFRIHAELDRMDGELDPVAELALYRIVQEALANAVRHARVSEATVTLTSANGVVTATIRDEGCGFELPVPEAVSSDTGVGITGMRERAGLVGGTVSIRTSPGKGTTVQASLPISGPPREGQ